MRPEGIHLTLKFLGETAAEKSESVRAALSGVHSPSPIRIRIAGWGFFPSERRPRVLWAGVEAGPELAELASAIEGVLEPLGIPAEEKPFRPHLTLARLDPKYGPQLRSCLTGKTETDFGQICAAEFHLYRSVLKPSSAEYTRLETYKFTGANSN